MVIQVFIDATEPLTGSASCNEREPVPFVGWRQMLRAVADLVGSPECAGGPCSDTADMDMLATDQHVGDPLPS